MSFVVEKKTLITNLFKRVPEIQDVLTWYGLDIDLEDKDVTIEDLARTNRLDPDELVDDLQATVDESDGDSEDQDEEEEDPLSEEEASEDYGVEEDEYEDDDDSDEGEDFDDGFEDEDENWGSDED